MELIINGTPLEVSMLLGYLHDLMQQRERQAMDDIEEFHVNVDGKEVIECTSPR